MFSRSIDFIYFFIILKIKNSFVKVVNWCEGIPSPKKKVSNAFQQFCGTKEFCLIFTMGDGEYFKKGGLKRKEKGVEKK